MTNFKNGSTLGSFGEFVYEQYLLSLGYDVTSLHILERDFRICNPSDLNSISYDIDVKTTQKNITRYTGKRVRLDILYELIVLNDGVLTFYPDNRSPLSKTGPINIGRIEDFYPLWMNRAKHRKTPSHNKAKDLRAKIKKHIVDTMRDKGIYKTRVIFRGSVSKSRWDSGPDNLPGTDTVISRYSSTIFVQMISDNSTENIQEIIYFDHANLDCLIGARLTDRQLRKGISKVIDLDDYKDKYENYVFKSIRDLESRL
jgi:hypothetical protein